MNGRPYLGEPAMFFIYLGTRESAFDMKDMLTRQIAANAQGESGCPDPEDTPSKRSKQGASRFNLVQCLGLSF
jgi:hypothetical protein